VPRPGEISLAHAGVLCLDELPEFRRNALEAMRQPLEEGSVTITRAMSTVSFPSDFMLVASMNPCPCGNLGHPTKPCRCTPATVRRYLSRVSGPLMDRIDIQVHVLPPTVGELEGELPATSETSEVVRERVERARGLQAARATGACALTNAGLPVGELPRVAALTGEGRAILRGAVSRLGLSARAYHRVLRIARTIADLAGAEVLEPAHVAEAVQYRSLDRTGPATR